MWEKKPSAVVPSFEGLVYQGWWERGVGQARKGPVGWEQARETGAIQLCSKKGMEREGKQVRTHTGWLLAGQSSWHTKSDGRLWGPARLTPEEATPEQAALGQFRSCCLGLLGMDF